VKWGGSVEIDSSAGRGTRITIRLPLTLAILDGLSVSVGGGTFIIPLTPCVALELLALILDAAALPVLAPGGC
jgi:chemotaxis protein histidine kinase CheA